MLTRNLSCQAFVVLIKKFSFWLIFGLLVSVLLASPQVHGQDSPITARVNKTNFFTDELVTLTVTVVDDSAQQPRPILPRLDGLAVIDLDISTEVETSSGKIFTEVTYVYRLQPRRTGLLTIPPVWVKIDDKTFKTPPISINVSQGAAPAPSTGNAARPDDVSPPEDAASENFLIESDIDISNPYVNQQIIHTFRFYQALQLYRQPQYEPPRFDGFEIMGLPVREYNLDIGEHTYLVTEIRTALFPKDSGAITIQPVRLMLPGNYFEDDVHMYTEPLTVQVQPLPDNAPADFSGAVGQYQMSSWIEPQTVAVNEAASLLVSINGTGNIHALPEPNWPDLSNWRAYSTLTSLTADMQDNGLMTGTRVFERLIVPEETGEFIIAPVSMVYFDPIAQVYRTITTEPHPITVTPQTSPAELPPTAIAALSTATPAGIAANPNAAPPDDPVNPIFSGLPEESSGWTLPLIGGIFVIICLVVPVSALVGAGSFWMLQKRKGSTTKKSKAALEQPRQHTHPLLAEMMQQYPDNYKATSQALIVYLESMLEIHITGLTRPEIARHLRRAGLDEQYVQRVNNCLAQSEIGRYGPITDDAGWSLMAEVDVLLFALDELQKNK